MKTKIVLAMLIAAGSATAISAFSPAEAQANYYTSPAYQAEEQAFRARQNEGARIYETFGNDSPHYQSWLMREKGRTNVNPYYNPYYGNINMYSSPYSWWY